MGTGRVRAVILDLRGHCIQTSAEQEFRRLMGEFFIQEQEEIPEEISLLRDFLESADFSRLRGSDPRLAGEIPCRVSVARDDGGAFSVTVLPHGNGT